MTDRTFHRIAATVWYALLIAMFLLAYRCKAQTVKPSLPPQQQATRTVKPATACRVYLSRYLPVTGWESCDKAHKTSQHLAKHGIMSYVERRIGVKP